jgi:hypothetical protein
VARVVGDLRENGVLPRLAYMFASAATVRTHLEHIYE